MIIVLILSENIWNIISATKLIPILIFLGIPIITSVATNGSAKIKIIIESIIDIRHIKRVLKCIKKFIKQVKKMLKE